MKSIEYTRPWMPEYQRQILDSKERFTVVEASTKTGKTASHIVWLFEQAIQGKEGFEYWWVAPVYGQAEIAFKRMKRQISDKSIFTANASKLIIRLINGSEIHFKSAEKPDNLYGENVVAAVFDEFTRAREESWHALRSTLTATQGTCKFIGNYTGAMNWGHKLGMKAQTDPNYRYFKITAYDAVEAGILNESEVEQARKDLPTHVFEALYLAKGALDDDILFEYEPMESMFSNTYVEKRNQFFLTADVALHGSDRFIITVWNNWVLVDIVKINKCEADEATEEIKRVAEKYKVPRHRIVYDGDGLGAFLRGYLRGAKSFVNNATPIQVAKTKVNYENLKAQCAYKLAKRIKDGDLYIEHQRHKDEIQTELEQYKKVEKSGGKFGITPKKDIKKVLGYSPDFADAIIMREFFELQAVPQHNFQAGWA